MGGCELCGRGKVNLVCGLVMCLKVKKGLKNQGKKRSLLSSQQEVFEHEFSGKR